MKKINKKYPVNYKDVLLIGISKLTNKEIKVIGYRIKKEKRFITQPKGWFADFIHYIEI
jgi:hypothetical protein